MGALTATRLEVPGVVLIEGSPVYDDRGSFCELHRWSSFADVGAPISVGQVNVSQSRAGVLRGLHFQSHPHQQAKLIVCLTGAIWDVAVDLRSDSMTFGKWVAVEMPGNPSRAVYVPHGFAHGFYAREGSTVLYMVDSEWAPRYDDGIRWNDPDIGIPWPCVDPILSDRDANLPTMADRFGDL